MDKACILQWMNDALKPYVAFAALGIIPGLLLDSYRYHMMSSDVEAINDIGVNVEHIPEGCTGLCQHVDVGSKTFFKRKKKEECMIEIGLIEETSEMNMPHCQHFDYWVSQAYLNMSSNVIIDSWRHTPINWFD